MCISLIGLLSSLLLVWLPSGKLGVTSSEPGFVS
jgi:hypothetical protein